MAFDAGMLASVITEIKNEALGAKIEKIHQPEKEQLILIMRSRDGGRRLLIDAGSNNPRLGFTFTQKENPMSPPMFCMLLRKHLTGAKLVSIEQPDFDRIAIFEFETYDEMGFPCRRLLIAEIMGKYSNLVFADSEKKIISVLKPVDFSTSTLRQLLPGMMYELPPKQDKLNPLDATEEGFMSAFDIAEADKPADKFISGTFLGISAVLAREVAFRASGKTDALLRAIDRASLWSEFSAVINAIKHGEYFPCMVSRADGYPVEYSFVELRQYGTEVNLNHFDTLGHMLDAYFEGRDHDARIKQRAADILHLLTSVEARITRKLAAQRIELGECELGEKYKKWGDLITANIYMLSRGMKNVTLTDYSDMNEDGEFGTCEIELDTRLSPSANAQRMYKKYTKSRTAKIELAKQIAIGEAELEYIYTVFDSLTRAETASDLAEIRAELHTSGYASKMKGYTPHKQSAPVYAKFVTDGGFTVLCGKNNVQNEYVTHKLAEKNDYWFHAKGVPGSHVVLVCGGNEPGDIDFTQAAEIAAFHSKAFGGHNIGVDYTLARNVKKPAGAKAGFVIYNTNWTAYVTPNGEKIKSMRVK